MVDDKEETQTGMLATLGSASRTSVDDATDIDVAPKAAAPDPVIDYDAEGGAVTTSENKKHSLMSLLKALDRDVFYARDDIGLNEAGGPCLAYAIAQKFPGINQQEFMETFADAAKRQKLRLPTFNFLHRHDRKQHGSKWIMVKSRADLLAPFKVPSDQIAAFAAHGNIKDFWPYEGEAHSSPNVRRRATFQACNAQFNVTGDASTPPDNATESASPIKAAKKSVTKTLKAGKSSSTASPKRKSTKVATTTTVDEAAKLLSSLTAGPPQLKKTKVAPKPKDKSSSLKAAPATTKKAAASTTTKKAASSATTKATIDSPRRKKAKVSTDAAVATTDTGITPLEETPVWKAYVEWLDKGSVEEVKSTKCPGFTLELIEGSIGIEAEKLKKTAAGFSHLCGEGLHNFAAKVSENETIDSKWPIVGALRSNRTKGIDLSWMWMVSMLEPYGDRKFAIHSAECVGESGDQNSPWPLCKECKRGKHGLFERCRKGVDIRAGPIPDKQRIDTLVCPTLSRKRMEQDREKFRKYQTKLGQLVAKQEAATAATKAATTAPSTRGYTFTP
jgi:hypothetical protein